MYHRSELLQRWCKKRGKVTRASRLCGTVAPAESPADVTARSCPRDSGATPPVSPSVCGIAKPLEHPLNQWIPVRLGDPEGDFRGPAPKGPDLCNRLQPCFFHVDHHAWHHDRFSTAAAQTHFSLKIRLGFRLISYWKRLLHRRLS